MTECFIHDRQPLKTVICKPNNWFYTEVNFRMPDNFWYRALFKIKIYETEGNSFQKLFSDIMVLDNPNFQTIAPWGKQGDGGNDGYIHNQSHYFQVYGPQATTNDSCVKACKKAREDFTKLQKNYDNIERYTFVYNDRFTGVPAPIIIELKAIKQENTLTDASFYGSAQLAQTFHSLTKDQKQDILGGIPSELPDFIEPAAISEILKVLADTDHGLPSLLTQDAPDFSTKIRLNGITEPVSLMLTTHSYQVNYIDDFFKKNDLGLKGVIAEEIKHIYSESKSAIPDEAEGMANLRYVWMVEQLIPQTVKQHTHSLKAYREAAQIIIAKYFETCDAYEHPDELTPE